MINYTMEQAHRLQELAESLRDKALTLKTVKDITAKEFPELGIHKGRCNREVTYHVLLNNAEATYEKLEKEEGSQQGEETTETIQLPISNHSNSRTFLYSRVSTVDQETSNQLLEAETAGYTIPAHRVVSESISGSTETSQRPLFQKLIDKLEVGDTLVVSRLDRLGRDAINVQSTIKELGDKGIKVVCLNLGNTDLTSPSGRLMVTMLSAVAQLERDLIIERTRAGLARAKAEGKTLGRPKATNTTEAVQRCKAMEWTQQQTADHLKVSVRTVKRHWS